MADHAQFCNDNLQWNISFTRLVHDWKVDLVTSFFDLLYSLRLRQGGVDEIYWIPSKRQTFEVKILLSCNVHSRWLSIFLEEHLEIRLL